MISPATLRDCWARFWTSRPADSPGSDTESRPLWREWLEWVAADQGRPEFLEPGALNMASLEWERRGGEALDEAVRRHRHGLRREGITEQRLESIRTEYRLIVEERAKKTVATQK